MLLALFATPAPAWEFTPGLPCILSHAEPGLDVTLTHDPTKPLFSITLTRPDPWPRADTFAIRFDGPSGLTITTNRHVLSDGGRSLTVTDTGFGNVLAGLALNTTAVALIGDQAVGFGLAGAAAPVEAFRDCRGDPSV